MGFSDSESEDDADAEKLFMADLLAGFPMWLERLCEGTLERFRVEAWPQMTSN